MDLPQARQAAGACVMTSAGCATCLSVRPSCPGWPPTFMPVFCLRLRVRFTFFQGRSSDGSSEELWESRSTAAVPRSTSRSSSRMRRRS